MTIPPSSGRRKTRLVRDEQPPDDLLVVVRATGSNPGEIVDDMVRDAGASGAVYAIERPDGSREVLFGVSVFAVRSGRGVAEALERFSISPSYLAMTVGVLRGAGFEAIPTGTNPDHFDIQLISGFSDTDPTAVVGEAELAARSALLLHLAGPPQPNPAYAMSERALEEP